VVAAHALCRTLRACSDSEVVIAVLFKHLILVEISNPGKNVNDSRTQRVTDSRTQNPESKTQCMLLVEKAAVLTVDEKVCVSCD